MRRPEKRRFLKRQAHRTLVLLGAGGLSIGCFLVLPLIQAMTHGPHLDTELRKVDDAFIPPPPPPPEDDQPEDEPEPEPEPPKLEDETPPLDLDQLEMALNAGNGTGFSAGIQIDLDAMGASQSGAGGGFSMADLDQRPRPRFRPGPNLTPALRRAAPGNVVIVFIVDERGQVRNPRIEESTDPIFDAPALAALNKWRFEPGKRNGREVPFHMRQSFRFPKN